MRRLLVTLCLLVIPTITQAKGLADAMPVYPGWEYIQNGYKYKHCQVYYRFAINPEFSGKYSMAQYKFSCDANSERMLWDLGNKNLRVFERLRIGPRSAKSLWLRRSWRWREVSKDSPQWREEMIRVIYIYGLHRQNIGIGSF